MSSINEMINNMCSEGIEKRPLWEVTAWDKKFNAVDKSMQKKIIKYKYLLAKELDELVDNSGDIRILYTTEDIAFTTEEKADGKISEGEIVAIPWGGNPTVKYYNGRFVTGDNRIATSLDKSRLDNKFLYYWMLGQLDIIRTFYRGAGIKHPSMFSVLSMEIPLPPLSIQQEIVSVLDSFTTLIDKMKQEVEKRKKQMEYYREKLLTFKDGECERLQIQDICKNICSGGTPSTKNKEYYIGEIPWLRTQEIDWNIVENTDVHISNEAVRNSSAKLIPAYCVIIAMYGATAAKSCVNAIPLTTNQACCNLEIDADKALYKYVYYFFCNEYEELKAMGEGSQNNINGQKIKNYIIPIPPLSKQSSIVSTLDKFESYISKLEKMIALRQKQYEYYREQLLTFE